MLTEKKTLHFSEGFIARVNQNFLVESNPYEKLIRISQTRSTFYIMFDS